MAASAVYTLPVVATREWIILLLVGYSYTYATNIYERIQITNSIDLLDIRSPKSSTVKVRQARTVRPPSASAVPELKRRGLVGIVGGAKGWKAITCQALAPFRHVAVGPSLDKATNGPANSVVWRDALGVPTWWRTPSKYKIISPICLLVLEFFRKMNFCQESGFFRYLLPSIVGTKASHIITQVVVKANLKSAIHRAVGQFGFLCWSPSRLA